MSADPAVAESKQNPRDVAMQYLEKHKLMQIFEVFVFFPDDYLCSIINFMFSYI